MTERSWAEFHRDVEVALAIAGRSYGVVDMTEMSQAFENGVSGRDYVRRAIARTDRAREEMLGMTEEDRAEWRHRTRVASLAEERAAGYTLD